MSKRKDQLMAAVEKATQKQHSAEQEKKRYLEGQKTVSDPLYRRTGIKRHIPG